MDGLFIAVTLDPSFCGAQMAAQDHKSCAEPHLVCQEQLEPMRRHVVAAVEMGVVAELRERHARFTQFDQLSKPVAILVGIATLPPDVRSGLISPSAS